MVRKNKKRENYDLKAMNATNPRFWQNFVIPAVLKRDKYKCINCGTKENLHVSHNHYGIDITIKDLETLCAKCHKAKDKKKGIYVKNYRNKIQDKV